jgi:hypothetical protein
MQRPFSSHRMHATHLSEKSGLMTLMATVPVTLILCWFHSTDREKSPSSALWKCKLFISLEMLQSLSIST